MDSFPKHERAVPQSAPVSSIMTRDPAFVTLGQTVIDAAKLMREKNCGFLPILDPVSGNRVVGCVTDRDIVVNTLAAAPTHHSHQPVDRTFVEPIDRHPPHVITEDETIADAEIIMRSWGVRRLPVVTRAGALIGVVSIDDLALHINKQAFATTAATLISEQVTQH